MNKIRKFISNTIFVCILFAVFVISAKTAYAIDISTLTNITISGCYDNESEDAVIYTLSSENSLLEMEWQQYVSEMLDKT